MGTVTKSTITNDRLLQAVERVAIEVRALRKDVALFVPSESVKSYKHPKRILASFRRAVRKFPPRT